jgi:hypothetical protein
VNKAVRFLLPVVIAVVLGPLIAGLALCLLTVATDIVDHTAILSADEFGWFVATFIFAYVMGGPIALIAGVLVALWMIWQPPSAIAVVAAAVIATAGFMGIGALGWLGPVQWANAHSNFLFTLACAVVAALSCWLLTRRFVPAATPRAS